MKRTLAVVLVTSTLILTNMPEASAWGDKGHESIALAATAYLTPAARQSIDALLAGDPDALTPPDIVSRATWADHWRDSDRNIPPSPRYRQTRAWHFADIEIYHPDLDTACYNWPGLAPGQAASTGPSESCVVEKIEQFAAELADPDTALRERQTALKFLLHFVGDLHQPLHAAGRNDKGGNNVLIVKPSGGQSNLHSFWDSAVVDKLGSYPEAIAAQIVITDKATINKIAAGDPRAWALESNQVANTAIYARLTNRLPDQDGKMTYQLDADYERSAVIAAKLQLTRAAIRLAVLLNRTLTLKN